MPQLDFSTYLSQIFWLAAFFTPLYIFTATFFAPRVNAIMQKRQQVILGEIEAAEKLVEEQNKLKERARLMLERAKDSARQKRNNSEKNAADVMSSRLEKLESNLAAELKKEEGRLLKVKVYLQDHLMDMVKSLRSEILKMIISAPAKHKKLN